VDPSVAVHGAASGAACMDGLPISHTLTVPLLAPKWVHRPLSSKPKKGPAQAKGIIGFMKRRWALFKPTPIRLPEVPDKVYLARLRIIETPWFSLFLHAIHTPDDQRYLHDHPWSFVSLVLRGGYEEIFAWHIGHAVRYANGLFSGTIRRTWTPLSVHRINRGEFHTIRSLKRSPTWTLLFVGPRRQDWGFATKDGWVSAETLENQRHKTARGTV